MTKKQKKFLRLGRIGGLESVLYMIEIMEAGLTVGAIKDIVAASLKDAKEEMKK